MKIFTEIGEEDHRIHSVSHSAISMQKSAGAIVFYRNNKEIEYLLLHYEQGHWGFPKGHIEEGEKPKEAAIRELDEETGIKDVKFIHGFKKYIKYFYKERGKSIFKIATFFLVQTYTRAVKLSYEHTGYKWLSYEEAITQLTFDNTKRILKAANEFLYRNFNKFRYAGKGVGGNPGFPPCRKTASEPR